MSNKTANNDNKNNNFMKRSLLFVLLLFPLLASDYPGISAPVDVRRFHDFDRCRSNFCHTFCPKSGTSTVITSTFNMLSVVRPQIPKQSLMKLDLRTQPHMPKLILNIQVTAILEAAVLGIAQNFLFCLQADLSPNELEYQQYLNLTVDMCAGVPANLILATDYAARYTPSSRSVKHPGTAQASTRCASAAASDHSEGIDMRHPRENLRYRTPSRMHRISHYAWSTLLQICGNTLATDEITSPMAKLFRSCGLTLGYDLTKRNKDMTAYIWGCRLNEDIEREYILLSDGTIRQAHVLDMVMQTIDPGFPSPPLYPETDDERNIRLAAKNDVAISVLRTLAERPVLPFRPALAQTHGTETTVDEQMGIRFLRNVLATNPHLFDPSTRRTPHERAPYAHYLARFGAGTVHSLHVREVSVSHRKTRESLAVFAGVRGGRRTPLNHYPTRGTLAKSRIRESGTIREAVDFFRAQRMLRQFTAPFLLSPDPQNAVDDSFDTDHAETPHGRIIPFPPNPYRRGYAPPTRRSRSTRSTRTDSVNFPFIGPSRPRYQPASRFKDPARR